MTRIVVACTFVPFSPSVSREVAERLVQALCAAGWRATVSALPVDPTPALTGSQCAGIRLLRFDSVTEQLICLGETAALAIHRDKRVWLAEGFDDLKLGVAADLSYEAGIGDARLLACAPGHPEAERVGALRLPVPTCTDEWRQASRSLVA